MSIPIKAAATPPYFSGNHTDFSHRSHLCLDAKASFAADLGFFQQESGLYSGIVPNYMINKWMRDINKKLYEFSGIPSHNG